MKIFKKRVAEAAHRLGELGFSALLITPGTNLFYLTGLSIAASERLILFILFPNSHAFLIGPAFEQERLSQNLLGIPLCLWQEYENPYRIVAHLVKRSGADSGKIAFEPSANFQTFDFIRRQMPEFAFEDASIMLEVMRITKSEMETAAIARAASKTCTRIEKVIESIKPGLTEIELLQIFGGGGMVQFGSTTAIPHANSGKRVLRKNDIIVIDACDTHNHYFSDITRTIFIGKPSPKMKQVFSIVRDAQEAAIEKLSPGARCYEVDRAARSVIQKAGFGRFFIHRTGHGLGLDLHEKPYLVQGNSDILVAGAVVTVEPGIYLPGEFGIRLEDDVLITDTGHRVLSRRAAGMTVL